jgi:hypothetical protein
MPPVMNLKTKKSLTWIPPNTTPSYKITIERGDGTIDDITNFISFAEFEDYVTDNVGQFEIRIWNPNEDYTSIWIGNEIVRYYKDYAATATTLRFRGRIEKPSKRFNNLNIKGRAEGSMMLDVPVTESYKNTETSTIATALFTTYLPTFTTTNINVSTVNVSLDWAETPLMEAMQELGKSTGFDFYVDSSLDAHYFLKGSVKNYKEAIVHGMNLLDVNDFTPDLTLIYNKVKVYGAVVNGVQVLATAEQKTGTYGTQNTNFRVRTLVINDENILTETAAQEIADYELSQRKNPPDVGSVKGFLLATIQPGEAIQVSSPNDGLDPGWYTTTGYKDRLDIAQTGEISTTVFINKEPRGFHNVLRDRVQQENKKKNTSINVENMDFSYNFLFEEDSGTHSNTEITGGVLKPTSSSGTWISPNRVLSTNLSEAYLLMFGQFIPNVTVSVSGNNGVSYQAFTANKTKLTLSSAIGKNIRIKVVFDSADAQLNALSILYKTE